MPASVEATPPPRRSTRERKQAEPFVSAPGRSATHKRKRLDADGDEDSKRKQAPRRIVQQAQGPRSEAPPEVNVKKITIQALQSGGLPDPFEGFRSVRDEAGNRMIFYGFTPNDTSRPGIYILHCGSLQCENILPGLQHDGVHGQFSQGPFPAFGDPIVVLTKPEPGESFLIIFGGEIGQTGINSTLIYVDITRKRWGEVPMHSNHPSAQGRVGAAACVVGSRLLIFGGATAREDEAKSYSLGDISFNEDTKRIGLTWKVKDKAYPEGVPYSGYFGGFALLDRGKHILLLPGGRGGEVTFSGEHDDEMTLYNTETNRFTRIPSGGLRALPAVRWYHSMPPPAALVSKLPQIEMGASLPPRPTDFLLSHTESIAVEETGERDHSHISHLWAVSVCTTSQTVKVKKIRIKEEVNRIWGEDKVEFFGFFTTAEKLCLWGLKEGETAEVAPYVAEIDI